MSQQAEKAPISERPTQSDDTTVFVKSKEAMTFDALCAGLSRAGLAANGPNADYRQYNAVLANCMDTFREAGLFTEASVMVAPMTAAQEHAALDAMRKGLCSAGIDHDSWDFVGERVLNSLRSAGLLQPNFDFENVIRTVEPNAVIWFRHGVSSVAQRPNGDYGRPITKAQAEKIASAIIASAPGPASVSEKNYGAGYRWLAVKFGSEDREFGIHYEPDYEPYYEPDEEAPR